MLSRVPNECRKGGVSPRTAQAAMRHSNIDLTMNVYTDPKLLDVQGALDSLPSLDWKKPHSSTGRAVMRATGTDGRDTWPNPRPTESAGATEKSLVAPVVAPNVGERGHLVSFPVIAPPSGDTTKRSSGISRFRSMSATNRNVMFSDQ